MHALVLLLAIVTAPVTARSTTVAVPTATPAVPAFGPHVVYGIIHTVAPSSIVIVRRNGQLMTIDIQYARAVGRTGPLYVGRQVGVYGTYDRTMHLHANAVTSANGLRHGNWPADF
jgi:hypothetical protein